MDPIRHDKVSRLFVEALRLDPAKRTSFLARRCGTDSRLREDVESLLRHDEQSGLLDAPETTTLQSDTVLYSTDPATGRMSTGPVPGYRIIRELGAGGMGQVFEAYDEKLRRRVALKLLAGHLTLSGPARERFDREAWITGRLTHPNIVKVFDRGEINGVSFYTMELVTGGSLHDVMRELKTWRRDQGRNLEYATSEYIAWAIRRIQQAASALHHAHQQQVVHRDIKPGNILLDEHQGEVKIADFGLAIDAESPRLTTTGRMLGTLYYMAPEQLLGRKSAIDHRADIYALGVTLFELVTLNLPYSAKTLELYMRSVLTEDPQRPRRLNELVSRDLEIVINKAIEKLPEDRYSSAREFADDLENVLSYRPIHASAPSLPARSWKWVRRRPLHAALAAALIIGIPVIGVLSNNAIQHRQLQKGLEIDRLQRQARLLSQSDRHQELVGITDEILSIDPRNTEAIRSRGLSYLKLSLKETNPVEKTRLQELSLSDFSALITADPEHTWPLRLKAFALEDMGREAEAEELRSRIQHDESNQSVDDLFFDAQLAYWGGEYAQAVELLDTLCARRPNWPDAFELRAMSREHLAERADSEDAYFKLLDGAINDLRVAVALNRDNPVYRYELGRLLTGDDALEEGAEHLQAALLADPELAQVHEGMADNLLRQGRQAVAELDVDAALALFREAEQEARDALRLLPDLAYAHLNLGASLAEQYRLAEAPEPSLLGQAIEHYEYVVSLGPQVGAYPRALMNLCDGLLQAGEPQRALDICEAVIAFTPDVPAAYYNLAGAHALLNQTDQAFQALQRDVELGDQDWNYLAVDPWFESLRADDRFTTLIGRMKNE